MTMTTPMPTPRVAVAVGLAGAMLLVACAVVLQAQSDVTDGPQYTNGTSLVRPDDYREWMFLSSGLNMTYLEEVQASGSQSTPDLFQNVFVNRSSYRHFMENGTWPDPTIFVLELRRAASDVSINAEGRTQTDLAFLEAEVKDSRFPDGWAFFNFGPAGSMSDVATPLEGAEVARCIECHTEHTAVERTFVQFYPTLYEAARQHGTLKPGF